MPTVPKALHRLVLTAGVAAVLLAGTAAPAQADGLDPVNCQTHPTNPQCVIVIGTPGSGTEGGGSTAVNCRDGFGRAVPCYIEGKGWLGDAYCYYQRAQGAELAASPGPGRRRALASRCVDRETRPPRRRPTTGRSRPSRRTAATGAAQTRTA